MKSFPVITDGHSRAARRVLVLKEELHSNRTPSASRVCVACMLDVRAEGGTGDTEDGDDGDRDHTTSARGGRAKRRRRRRKLYRKTAYRITRLGRSVDRDGLKIRPSLADALPSASWHDKTATHLSRLSV